MLKQKLKNNNDTIAHLADKNVDGVVLEYSRNTFNKDYGFIQLLDQLVNYPQLSLSSRLVYCALRNYSGQSNPKNNKQEEHKVWTTNVTNATVAERLGISPTTVSSSISQLQELGIIKLHKSRSKNARIIEIVRDFAVPQPEQLAYEEDNPAIDDDPFEFDDYCAQKGEDAFSCNEAMKDKSKKSLVDEDFPF